MKFETQQYSIADAPNVPFIDASEIESILENTKPDTYMVRDVIQKSLEKNRLSLQETAVLANATDPGLVEEIMDGAKALKEKVYGNRIVLFAPLYIGNECINNCQYCGFRVSNRDAERLTLSDEQIVKEVEALEENGQKRLILVFGEHHQYSPEFIAEKVKLVYSIKKGQGEIRRVNINAAPLNVEGFRTVHQAGIGTFQVFQETYHPGAYKLYHPSGRKSHYENRLLAFDRAFEAGLDDVGIGALFGLYDWRFEVLAMVRHTNHLEACYNIGPHTISFPRLKEAASVNINNNYLTDDDTFARLVAILRLAVPYTGMILTAREPAWLRNKLIRYGVSQIDGGTKIELGSYASHEFTSQNLNREQFKINDERSLNEIIEELLAHEQLPSFCTACYRLKRTGEHFMEFSVPGFIKRFCGPNAILTLAEYLEDYAPEQTYAKGWDMIRLNVNNLEESRRKPEIEKRLERIKNGERDLYF